MSTLATKAIFYAFMLAGLALLWCLNPWLKSFGTVVYVVLTFLYMFLFAILAHQVFNRLTPSETQSRDQGAG
nr:putative integron gene cassette protein [uncultured bacterium]CAS02976.1 putative integron gene cassette protein [uncultured bacterium]